MSFTLRGEGSSLLNVAEQFDESTQDPMQSEDGVSCKQEQNENKEVISIGLGIFLLKIDGNHIISLYRLKVVTAQKLMMKKKVRASLTRVKSSL